MKKDEIVKAAKELFSKYGYRKVSMDEIAKEASVTKKTIYTYFKDKKDLIKYFLYEELEKMKTITEKIDKKNISFEDKLHEVIEIQIDYRNNSRMLKALLKDAPHDKIAEECEQILNMSIRNDIKKKLDQAIKEGYIKHCDTEIVSFLIYKIYIALMIELDKPIDKQEATDNIMNILKAWLLK